MRYLLLLFLFLIPTGADAVWFDSSWDYRVKVEVDPSKVAGSTNLTNYPVYLNLDDLPAEFHANVKSDGCDIRLIESNETTETAFELVAYDSGADTGELHFKADSLDYAATTTFYVYYGNAAASCYAVGDTYGRNAVWSDYEFVYHGDSNVDATGNHSPTAMSATLGASGKVGGALSLTGAAGSRIEVGTDTNILGSDPSTIVVTAWGNNDTLSGSDFLWSTYDSATGDSTYTAHRWIGTTWFYLEARSGGTSTEGGQTPNGITKGTWVHTAYRLNKGDTSLRGYKNGSQVANLSLASTGDYTDGGLLYIGALRFNNTFTSNWDGLIDEFKVRVSDVSADWITTEYNNQSSPATFYYIGAQETDGGGGGGASTDSGIIWFD